uniref:Uncharacterized protein n=1 Tax=Romanomermis culicivorax TaxID=13658 RepID=A0A915HUS3_ROMCU
MTINKSILVYLLLCVDFTPLETSNALSLENTDQNEISNLSYVEPNSLFYSYQNVSSYDNYSSRSLLNDGFVKYFSFKCIHDIIHVIPKWFLIQIEVKPFPDHLLSDSDLTNYTELIGSIKRNYAP